MIIVPKDQRASDLLRGEYLGDDETVQIVRPTGQIDMLLATVLKVRAFVLVGAGLVGVSTLLTFALVIVLSLRLRARELQTMANHEVADLVWLPFSWLQDRANAYDYRHPKDPNRAMPAVLISSEKEQILWGLSLRILQIMHDILEQDLPVVDQELRRQLETEDKGIASSELTEATRESIKRRVG